MELDARELGGANFHAQKIITEFESTRLQIAQMIQDQRGGARPGTTNPTRGTIGGQAQTIHLANGPGWHIYSGDFHMLPKDWQIPSMTFVQFITIRLLGDPDNGVPPLSKIGTYHWKGHALQHRRVCNDMKFLTKHVRRIAIGMDKWKDPAHQWLAKETLVLYGFIANFFMFRSRNGSIRSRFNEFSWQTIVNLVRNHKGLLVGEQAEELIQ